MNLSVHNLKPVQTHIIFNAFKLVYYGTERNSKDGKTIFEICPGI